MVQLGTGLYFYTCRLAGSHAFAACSVCLTPDSQRDLLANYTANQLRSSSSGRFKVDQVAFRTPLSLAAADYRSPLLTHPPASALHCRLLPLTTTRRYLLPLAATYYHSPLLTTLHGPLTPNR